jgi:hypothetical protein
LILKVKKRKNEIIALGRGSNEYKICSSSNCKRKRKNNAREDRIKKFCLPQNRTSLEQKLPSLKLLQTKDEKKYSGLEVRVIDANQGYGVFTSKDFKRGEIACDFRGKILTTEEAIEKEKKYAEMGIKHDYTMQFKWNDKPVDYVLDPTDPKHGYGRLLNHSRSNANVVLQMSATYNQPQKSKFFFIASKNICQGDQLLWDYDPNNSKLDDLLKDNI